MAPRLEPESRRLLAAFSANLNRLDPQPLDWQRFYDFILCAFGHEPPSAEGQIRAGAIGRMLSRPLRRSEA